VIKASEELGQRLLAQALVHSSRKGPRPMGGDAALQMWVRRLYMARSTFPTPNHEIKSWTS
jgi:hypothetical protein